MRKKISSGDIFEVNLGATKRYFQFLYKDDEYMAGHLIRAFKFHSLETEVPSIEEIFKSGIDFYTYTSVIEGLKNGLWTYFSNKPIEKILILLCLDKQTIHIPRHLSL